SVFQQGEDIRTALAHGKGIRNSMAPDLDPHPCQHSTETRHRREAVLSRDRIEECHLHQRVDHQHEGGLPLGTLSAPALDLVEAERLFALAYGLLDAPARGVYL